jgi:hypothetical protein
VESPETLRRLGKVWLKRLTDSLQNLAVTIDHVEEEFRDVLTAGDFRIHLGLNDCTKIKNELIDQQNKITELLIILDKNCHDRSSNLS